jgi:hypothetical protein
VAVRLYCPTGEETMMKRLSISRQILISTLVATLFGAAAPAAADTAVRLSWQEFVKDPKRVASLRKAVAAMKALNSASHASADYRKSWQYWANIHGYFGPDSPFGTLAQNMDGISPADKHFFNGVSDVSPPDQIAKDVWAQCQHGTRWFFAWHRLYLLYFEKQLQTASGDPKLRLPYWDYTDPAHVAMPAEFTQQTYKDAKGVKRTNPLYESRRAPGWRRGSAKLQANATKVDNWLNKEKNFDRFQDGIEMNVHGYVHCTIATNCPVVDMGAVPYSSNDPIFWLHHANIDRLWSCWSNLPARSNPSDGAFVNQPFSFVDPAGQKVTAKVAELFGGALIDYKYEKETNCARTNPALVAENAASVAPAAPEPAIKDMIERQPSLNKPVEPVRLTAATTKVNVELRGDNEQVKSLALGARPAGQTRTELILSGITFSAPPGVQFNVYLELPDNPGRREYAGTINFFGVAPAGAQAAHRHSAAFDAEQGLTRDFDVTDALRNLGQDHPDLANVTVSFEATNGRAGSTQAAEINAKAQLTVKSIEFRVEAAQ